ncbi:MAG: DUF3634 family protein [Acidobacteriota bacterium]
MGLAVLAIVAVALWIFVDRANELFCLSWRNGQLRLVRGRIPPALKRDLGDALAHMKIAKTTVRARREDRGLRLTAAGLDDFATQRLRNILQIYPVSQLRAAREPQQNRVWRMLGFASLIWLFGRADD